MYTTLDFLVRLNARRFIVGASPELKFRTADEADTAHVVVVGASEPFKKKIMPIKVNPVSIVSFFHALYDP